MQNRFHVLDRAARAELDFCAAHGLAFVPFFPLGSAFTGGPAKLAEEPTLARIAAKHEATPAQVALAWLLAVGPHVLLIPGTASVAHLEENLAAAELALATRTSPRSTGWERRRRFRGSVVTPEAQRGAELITASCAGAQSCV